MSNRRLDISSLLCTDDDKPPLYPSPSSASSSPSHPLPHSLTATHPQNMLPLTTSTHPPHPPSRPFIGLEALVHVATEERRRLSAGSDAPSSRHASPVEDNQYNLHYSSARHMNKRSPEHIYAQPLHSPAREHIIHSPVYSPCSQRPRDDIHFSDRRTPISPYVHPGREDESQRYHYSQRQAQQEQWSHQQRFGYDASPRLLPQSRAPPSMQVQFESSEQLHLHPSPSLPAIGRTTSGSVPHRHPLSPMQLDFPTSRSISRGSPLELPTSGVREPPTPVALPTSLLKEPATIVTREYQPSDTYDTSASLRQHSPISILRDGHSKLSYELVTTSPTMPLPPSTPFSGAVHQNKKRRHSDSPSCHPTALSSGEHNCHASPNMQRSQGQELPSMSLTQTFVGSVSKPLRSTSGAGGRNDTALDFNVMQKVVSTLARRSPPRSVDGGIDAAHKSREPEGSRHEVTEIHHSNINGEVDNKELQMVPETVTTDKPDITKGFISIENQELKPSADQQDAHEWLLEQCTRSPSPIASHEPEQPTRIISPSNSPKVPAVAYPPTVYPRPSPSPTPPFAGPRKSPSPVATAATLEQELEELLAEPEDDKMDVDLDRAVTQLVADTLGAGEEAATATFLPPQPDIEADVDIELLRLVDDQSIPVHEHEPASDRGRNGTQLPLSPVSHWPRLSEKGEADNSVPVRFPASSSAGPEQGPMPPPTVLVADTKGNQSSAAVKKSSKASGSKKKETTSKSTKKTSTATNNTAIKPKAKASKSKAKTSDAAVTPPLVPPKPNKVPIPPPVKKSASSTAASRSRSTSVMPSGSAGPEGDSKALDKQEEEESSDAANDDDKLYCVCKTKYDEDRFMIACDRCDEWYHTQCVDMSDLVVDLVDQFFCPICIEKNPTLLLQTTYKPRCLNGIEHTNPNSSNACHKPALGGGFLSKFCSQECGVKYMEHRINAWVKRGGKKEQLWESVKHAEKREGVVIRVDRSKDIKPEIVVKAEPLMAQEELNRSEIETITATSRSQGKAIKSQLEVERLRHLLNRIVKMREEVKQGMEVVIWREKLLELASERAKQVDQCGWDQRLCFGYEEWAEFGADVLVSYESVINEVEGHMLVDGAAPTEGEGEWWCPGKIMCDRHAGWQAIRAKDICNEREQREESLAKLTTRERELRKRIEDIVDPHETDSKDTPSKASMQSSFTSWSKRHVTNNTNRDPARKGKKRKSLAS
ncbi:hypothetical protein AMATHDRAFT_44374 [Amanita thiersii Skay4041]|uniref:PHD-type domain-containing protein n=1 Tax=Amanita thiersii Skay4041 TaxID=703135 RepID=A0A2A9NU61_9AGAR|nr:hypothetical protein AMATHDRAFT_44374 [Amanita thiersii Skay4041]